MHEARWLALLLIAFFFITTDEDVELALEDEDDEGLVACFSGCCNRCNEPLVSASSPLI